MLDLAPTDVNPLARLARPPFELELFRSHELVVVERGGHDLSKTGTENTWRVEKGAEGVETNHDCTACVGDEARVVGYSPRQTR